MKQKFVLLWIALELLLLQNLPAQQPSPPFECWIDTTTSFIPDVTDYAPNGGVFTPKGDLRALIIFVGASDENVFPRSADTANFFIPGWNAFDSITGAINLAPNAVEPSGRYLPIAYKDTSDFVTFANDTSVMNLSKFWYLMSNGTFRFMADVYRDPVTNLPIRINIDKDIPNTQMAIHAAIDSMKAHDPGFDWSPYDNRQNKPDYGSDNSLTGPDHKPDYIIMVFRMGSRITGIPLSYGSFMGGGVSEVVLYQDVSYNGYTITRQGFTLGGGAYFYNRYSMFAHEIAHELYKCPHYGDHNGVIGKYWQQNRMWGSMTLEEMPFQTMNAWERWYIGWTELVTGSNHINSDILSAGDLPPGGIFHIRDYITTGDVIRIKLPYTSDNTPQYLWLENHLLTSHMDSPVSQFKRNGLNQWMGLANPGIAAFIEDIEDDRTSVSNTINQINSIRLLHPLGNYDFLRPDTNNCPHPPNWFYNRVYEWQTGQPNPISGHSVFQNIRGDYNDWDTIGCPRVHPKNNIINWGGNINGGDNEGYGYKIIHRDGNYTYDLTGRNATWGTVGQKMGIGTNTPILNTPVYDPLAQVNKYFLNGLSVEILAVDSDSITVKVRFDDIVLEDDLRWCGNITLKDIVSGPSYDLHLAPGKRLTLNRSGTPERHTLNSFDFTFTNPTFLEIDSNATFYLDSAAELVLQNRSYILLRSGAKLVLAPYNLDRFKILV